MPAADADVAPAADADADMDTPEATDTDTPAAGGPGCGCRTAGGAREGLVAFAAIGLAAGALAARGRRRGRLRA